MIYMYMPNQSMALDKDKSSTNIKSVNCTSHRSISPLKDYSRRALDLGQYINFRSALFSYLDVRGEAIARARLSALCLIWTPPCS